MREDDVASHYTHGSLLAIIREGLKQLGKSPETVSVDDLGPVDEFHIGGRQASGDFLGQLGLAPESHVLDVGCGLGGGTRFTASRYGSQVTGIDLTPEFVETGQALCEWVGLGDHISLRVASALDLPFEDGHFDAAYMMHVGMNIADKVGLCAEVSRVIRPGGVFGVYDVMRTGDGDLAFPVPWSQGPENSAVATPQEYRGALSQAGLKVSAERDRKGFALEFFADMAAKVADAGGPPPLGIHLLMGEERGEKVKNMVANISAGLIAPVEMIARKPA